jgi:cystathionine gamma-synthase
LDSAHEKIKFFCGPLLKEAEVKNIQITNSGMNAVFSAITAINKIQAPQGKKIWIQLGWLYVDSAKLLEKIQPDSHMFIKEIQDLESVEKILKAGGVAGIFAEAPNNPQLETPDILKAEKIVRYLWSKTSFRS